MYCYVTVRAGGRASLELEERLHASACPQWPRLTSSPQVASVLIVDDFQPFREAVSEILRQRPQLRIVGEASDGLEAVQKAIELMPDLILLDIGLPGIDGLEASKRIHAVVPGAKIIFVSMNGSAVIMRAALSNGATGYVLKADAGSELLTAIEAAFQGRRFVSSGLAGRIPTD
jgi:DNA-binding NarL/FixJ family response regulator